MFIVDNALMSGNIYGKGLSKKQGVNEEKEQFIVILMVVSVLHDTVHTCVKELICDQTVWPSNLLLLFLLLTQFV